MQVDPPKECRLPLVWKEHQGGCPQDTLRAVPPGAGVSQGVPAAHSSLGHGPSQGVGVPNAARNAIRNAALHGVTDWFGLEGTLKITQFQPHAVGKDTSHYPKLLQAPSSLTLDIPGMGTLPTLGNLCQGLITLTGNFFLISKSHLSSSLKPFLLVLSLSAL